MLTVVVLLPASHDINYMVAFPLIYGNLTSESYTDESAKDPRIDELRAKITCVEDQRFSVEYHEPSKRSIGNALLVELKDGTVLDATTKRIGFRSVELVQDELKEPDQYGTGSTFFFRVNGVRMFMGGEYLSPMSSSST